ncbi:MAG: hypothetical protein N2167_02190 [Flavobacteriales bacterium]|nr:hypothetical protein [Flavobacteriales bacterium]
MKKKEVSPYNQSLSEFNNNRELVIGTIFQINKDFASLGVNISESLQANVYQVIFDTLRPLLEELYENQLEKFYGLMYTIDVDHSKIDKAFLKPTLSLAYDEITDLVIQREILKVATRIWYKNQNPAQEI